MNVKTNIQMPPELERILETLANIYAGNLLDVATGKGVFLRFLMKSMECCEQVVGVDISMCILSKARATFSRNKMDFLRMKAVTLALKGETFDTVSIADSLHHIESVSQILTEMHRVLKPEGI